MTGFWLNKTEDGEEFLEIRMLAPHQQATPYFYNYDPSRPKPGTELNYSDPTNVVGHLQRCFICYWALRGFTELGGTVGADLGGSGVLTPGCISVDYIGTGEKPNYGGTMVGVSIKADAEKLAHHGFGANCFSSVVSNHLIEHLSCLYCPPNKTPQERKAINCDGAEIRHVIQSWVTLLKSGGYVAAITPDEKFMEGTGSSFLYIDDTHRHAFDSRTFRELILDKLQGIEIIEYANFNNNFSFEWVIRKL